MLTGHEGKYLAIMGTTVLLRLASFVVLIPLFGVAGAAAASTLSLVLVSLLLRQAVRRRTGIDGSVLRLLARRDLQSQVPAQQAQG
jgi:O-antigen/teichoic acid export membrane protein